MKKAFVFLFPLLLLSARPEVHDRTWLKKALLSACKYPVDLQKKNREACVLAEYRVDGENYSIGVGVIRSTDKRFDPSVINAFTELKTIRTRLPEGKDTLKIHYRLQEGDRPRRTPACPDPDVVVIGYGMSSKKVLVK